MTATHPPGSPPGDPKPPQPPTGPGRWPDPTYRTPTAEPRPRGMDLADAAASYAEQLPEAVKRRGGFWLGDPVRRQP